MGYGILRPLMGPHLSDALFTEVQRDRHQDRTIGSFVKRVRHTAKISTVDSLLYDYK